jgi:cytochrome c-type biogenesis protein CcsB
MDAVLFKIAVIGYVGATLLFLLHLGTLKEVLARVAKWTLFVFFLVHAAEIGVRWADRGITPVTNFAEALSLFAWILAGGYLLLQLRYKIRTLGAFVTPLVVVMLLGSFVFTKEQLIPESLKSAWLPIHVSMAFLGDAALGLAFVTALAYLIRERQVKNKKLGALHRRLPSLETLDAVNYRCIIFGFPLLTLGIITGSLWAKSEWGNYWSWEPRETWSLVTWLIFGVLLHVRLTAGWRGKRTAILTIVGFAVMLGSFVGIRIFDLGLHAEFR